jgi:aspartate racemase
MKTLGMIGGLGPESTVDYYKLIVDSYRQRIQDGSYPPLIINVIDLQKIIRLMEAEDYATLTNMIVAEVQKLAKAGAEFGLIGSNTPHIAFDQIQRRSAIPLISIVQATRDEAQKRGLSKLGLFGSGFTMKARFYPDTFSKQGIAVIMPEAEEQSYIHRIYMDELVRGVFLPETRARLLQIVKRMKEQNGIDGLILGGTELPLILRDTPDAGIPFLDTARIHVNAAVQELLS